jgi:hypothetical protein
VPTIDEQQHDFVNKTNDHPLDRKLSGNVSAIVVFQMDGTCQALDMSITNNRKT